jgi:glycosyltransferase involved in cell wall biosynthesis
VEVAAAGRPTIAFRAGGACETIIDNRTGMFFDRQTPEDLATAIEQFEKQSWSPDELRRHADNFRVEVFNERFLAFLARIGAPVRAADGATRLANTVNTFADVGA